MGWAARKNLNSKWNRDRNADLPQATTPLPVKKDEPLVIELSIANLWSLLCRRLKASTNHAPTS